MITALYRLSSVLFYALILLLLGTLCASAWGADLPPVTPPATASDWQRDADHALQAVVTASQALVHLAQQSSAGFWAMLSTAGLALLYIGKRLAPLLRFAGPWGAVIDGAWSFVATLDQQKADQVQSAVTRSAATAKPLFDALRAIPLTDLPPSLAVALQNPHVAMALQELAVKPAEVVKVA